MRNCEDDGRNQTAGCGAGWRPTARLTLIDLALAAPRDPDAGIRP